MPLTYAEVLASLFADHEFTAGEFRRRTGNLRAASLLSEMKRRGYVARVGRGRYRCLGPADRPDLRVGEFLRVRRTILEAPLEKAWAGPSAVEAWTNGNYVVNPSPFRIVFHVAIPPALETRWLRYLRRHRVPTHLRKHVGVSVELVPRRRWRVAIHRGETVVPLTEVRELIRTHPALYGGAEEWIPS